MSKTKREQGATPLLERGAQFDLMGYVINNPDMREFRRGAHRLVMAAKRYYSNPTDRRFGLLMDHLHYLELMFVTQLALTGVITEEIRQGKGCPKKANAAPVTERR